MREFNLGHVIGAYSHYASALNSLWALFAAASFSAAGFGASMAKQFTVQTVVAVTVAYLLFAAGHLFAIHAYLNKLRVIADEVRARMKAAPAEFTEYPRTVSVYFGPVLTPLRSVTIHIAIDACVICILWSGLLWPAVPPVPV